MGRYYDSLYNDGGDVWNEEVLHQYFAVASASVSVCVDCAPQDPRADVMLPNLIRAGEMDYI